MKVGIILVFVLVAERAATVLAGQAQGAEVSDVYAVQLAPSPVIQLASAGNCANGRCSLPDLAIVAAESERQPVRRAVQAATEPVRRIVGRGQRERRWQLFARRGSRRCHCG